MLNIAKSRAFACIAIMASLSGCGAPALIIYNDTKNSVSIDVIKKEYPRKPYFRSLKPGLTLNSKSCSHDISNIYIRDGGSDIFISPKDVCSEQCECRVVVSVMLMKK